MQLPQNRIERREKKKKFWHIFILRSHYYFINGKIVGKKKYKIFSKQLKGDELKDTAAVNFLYKDF